MNCPNLLQGAMIKSEDARTTSIPESAGTVAAHDPNHVSTMGTYKPKAQSYPDGTLGASAKSAGDNGMT